MRPDAVKQQQVILKVNDNAILRECDLFRALDRVVVAGGSPGRVALRAFPTLVNFGNGELLVGYDLSRDHHLTPPMGFMLTRSRDGGRTWTESFALCALPGYHVTGNLGLMKCPDGSVLCALVRAYYPGWRQYKRVSCEQEGVVPAQEPFPLNGNRNRRVQKVHVRSWDKGYNWTPACWDDPIDLFPGKFNSTHTSGDDGPYELSDGRWMMPIQGMDSQGRFLGAVTYSNDQGSTWSPVQIIHDYPYGGATEQRIYKLDAERYLSYTRVDPVGPGPKWNYENNVVHFTLSEDKGKTWSTPWKGNFMGSGAPEIVRLTDGTMVCFYRDMDASRTGLGASHSSDEGRTWTYLGRLCGPAEKGWCCEFGYPVATRLDDSTIFLVYYGPRTADGNADIVGVFLEDKTKY